MEFKDNLELINKCFDKFNKYYNDHNFTIITQSGARVRFNFRQSEMATFLGISEKFLTNIDYSRSKDFLALVTLVKNTDYYLQLFNEGKIGYLEVFTENATEKLNSFLNMREIKSVDNSLFCVFLEDNSLCYLFVNDKNSFDDGYFLVLENRDNYCYPKEIIKVNNYDDFKSIIDMGKVEIVSRVNDWDKVIGVTRHSSCNIEEIKRVADMLVGYGKEEFNLSKQDIQDILFVSQYQCTKWINSNTFGYDNQGKIKINCNGLNVLNLQLKELNKLREEVRHLQSENERLQEISYDALEELYYTSLKNSPKGIKNLFKKRRK